MKTRKSSTIRPGKIIEPVTTLFDERDFFRIRIELPGIAEERIKIDLENHSHLVTIIAFNSYIKYKKIIPIPCEFRFYKKQYLQETLELILEKLPPNILKDL